MSRVYWHTRDGGAELSGAERGWCHHLAAGLATAAWDLTGFEVLERLGPIMQMIPEVPEGRYGANFLHRQFRAAVEADRHARERSRAGDHGHFARSGGMIREFVRSFDTSLRVEPPRIVVAGHSLRLSSVNLNTALVAGSDPIRLAAKLHGWCELHCWVDGPHRAWLADVIDSGRQAGLYRPGMGWENVQVLLRATDTGPVVLSYSVTDQFPGPFQHPDAPAWPDGVPRRWDALTAEQQQTREAWEDSWRELDPGETFDAGMVWLRAEQPWAQITPDNLATASFGPPVTVYDLFAGDRDERVARAIVRESEPE